MRKVLSIVIAAVMLGTLLYGCAGSKNEEQQTTAAATTTTTEATTEAKNTADYLPNGIKAKDLLMAYFEEHGYSFSGWNIVKDTSSEYQASAPGGGAGIVASYDSLVFNIGGTNSNNSIIINEKLESIISIQVSSSSYDAYEILSLLFSNCPDSLKPPVAEIKEKTEERTSGYVDIEKNGVYYRATKMSTSGGAFTMIGVYRTAPNGWNG